MAYGAQIFEKIINEAWEQKETITKTSHPDVVKAIKSTIDQVDQGIIRVAEKKGSEWVVNQWIKKAILLSFRTNEMQTLAGPYATWWDKVRGKTAQDTEQLIKDAIAVEKAGAFAIVVEGVMSDAALKITEAVNIPIIGIGAGNVTDGQVLVWSDMLGFFEDFKPKFVRHYLNGASLVKEAVNQYRNDVQDSSFPAKEEEY